MNGRKEISIWNSWKREGYCGDDRIEHGIISNHNENEELIIQYLSVYNNHINSFF